MQIVKYIGATILGIAGMFAGCHNNSDKKPNLPSAPQDATANVRVILEDMISANEEIEVVTGLPLNLAQQMADDYSAWYIQKRLNNELQARHGSYTPVARRFENEIGDRFGKYRIFIGMEAFNAHVAGIRSSMLDQQYRLVPQDVGSIEGYDAPKDCIVVTGPDAAGVLKAGYAFSEYDRTLQNGSLVDVDGKIIRVTGVLPDLQTTVVEQ